MEKKMSFNYSEDTYNRILTFLKKVDKHDHEAVGYLCRNYMKLMADKADTKEIGLAGLLIWGSTRQGHEYWSKIDEKISGGH